MIGARYSYDREIGRGGTGSVWLGRDELLGRRVALKRLGLAPGDDRVDGARADREAELSARLQHPHVVAVFDLVTDPRTGERWLVMEHVDGVTLADLVRPGRPLPEGRVASLLGQAAEGLLAAHAAGITHRDVKPSNILVGTGDHVKITDFGIARRSTDPSLTRTGLVTGSPGYIAPEVASGARGDEAADVWSLGATAYHLIAGRPPYEPGDHVLAMLYRIVNEEPPRLPDRSWAGPLLEGTMERDPARRWSMEQVRDFLARPGPRSAWGGAAGLDVSAVAGGTQVLTRVGGGTSPLAPPGPSTPSTPAPPSGPPSEPRRWALPVGLGLAACLLLAVLLQVLLHGGPGAAKATEVRQPAASPTRAAPASPSARGMESFIRDYVRTVADDPDAAWEMLTPKFQRESGGLEHYRSFWGPARNGRVTSITADPDGLSVSYQVHFDHWHNGPGPTVLDLVFDKGRYLIDGEHTKGFVPAG